MQFNNEKFGKIIEVLKRSVFNQDVGGNLLPPTGDSFLLDDKAVDEPYLLDDSDDYLIDD